MKASIAFFIFSIFLATNVYALPSSEVCSVLAEGCKNHGGETCQLYVDTCG